MNIGKQQRVIVVQPEPVQAPATPNPEPRPLSVPEREPVAEPAEVGVPA